MDSMAVLLSITSSKPLLSIMLHCLSQYIYCTTEKSKSRPTTSNFEITGLLVCLCCEPILIEIINDVLIRMVHSVFGITIQRQHVSFGDSGNVNKTKLNDADAINRITKSHFLFMRPPLLDF